MMITLTPEQQRRLEAAVAAGQFASVEEAVEAATVGFARIPWDVIKDGGEAVLAREAISVRCLQTADGGLPAGEDDPDLVAYVARSY